MSSRHIPLASEEEVHEWMEQSNIARLGQDVHPPFRLKRRRTLQDPVSLTYVLDQWLIDRMPCNIITFSDVSVLSKGVVAGQIRLARYDHCDEYSLRDGTLRHAGPGHRKQYEIRYKNIYELDKDIFTPS